jgi:hypothetical protein
MPLSGSLTTQTASKNPCTNAKQYVGAIKLHPHGGAAQIYTVQVLDTQNSWQTLNINGLIAADKDTPWLPLTFGSNRCVSQVLIYGDGVGKPITLEIDAQVSQ